MPTRGIPIGNSLHGPTRSMGGPIASNNILDTIKRKKINENGGSTVSAEYFIYHWDPIFQRQGCQVPSGG